MRKIYTQNGGWQIESSGSPPHLLRRKSLYRNGKEIVMLTSTAAAIMEKLIENVGEFVGTEAIKEVLPRSTSEQSGAVYGHIRGLVRTIKESDKQSGRKGESISRETRKGIRLNPVGTTVIANA